MTTSLELFSGVALLRDVSELGLRSGHVGTVVKVYSAVHVDVEFLDDSGKVCGLTTLRAEDLLRLHHDPVRLT